MPIHSRNCGAQGFDGYDAGECTCGLEWRIKLQAEANEMLAWPVASCSHGMEGDEGICDGCMYDWEKSVAKAREKLAALAILPKPATKEP